MDWRPDGDLRNQQAFVAMQLSWAPSFSASALHAAEAIDRFHANLTDPRVAESLTPYAKTLGQWIDGNRWVDPSRFWGILIAQASLIESNHELAESVLRKICGSEFDASSVAQLAGCITDVEAAYKSLFPKFAEQLPLRGRPLQEQWLGYGTGLLAHIGRLTERGLIADGARVILLQPVLGGFGYAHLEINSVSIEAVLTNPLVEIPEVVRLAWLLAQLQLDVPKYSESAVHLRSAGPLQLHRIAPIAMLPAALAAGEVMELSRCDEATAALALEHWHIPVPKRDDAHGLASILMDWWETYLQTKPVWSTALQALSKMLQ